MEWSESLEPGCIPWAPPTGIRSPDEHLDALRARISAGVRPSIDTLVAGVSSSCNFTPTQWLYARQDVANHESRSMPPLPTRRVL